MVRSRSFSIPPLDLKPGSNVNVALMTHTDTAPVPNHHHDYPGFAGPSGLLAALSMAFGRAGDARLAMQLAGLDRTDAVVDIGCGPGTAARRAAARGASVTGVEPA